MTNQQVIPGVGTSAAPSCTHAMNSLWLAWKGEGSDLQIYFTHSTIPEFGGTGPVPYLPQAHVTGALSDAAPSITHFNSTICVAWKNASDGSIYWSTWSETNAAWETPVQIVPEGPLKANTSSAPAIVGVGPLLYLCWRGQPDNQVWWSTWSPSSKLWSPAFIVPITSTDAAPAMASDGTFVYLAWKSATDNNIWWCSSVGGSLKWGLPLVAPTTGTVNGPSLAFAGGAYWLAWQGFQFQNLYYTSLKNPVLNTWNAQTPVVGLATGSTPSLAATMNDSSGIVFACKAENANTGIYYGPLRLPPQKYIFTIPSFNILNMRSGNAVFGKSESDTDYVCLAVQIGSGAPQIVTQFVGDQTGGTVQVSLLITGEVQDSDLVTLHYTIVNSSQGSKTIQYLANAATSFVNAVEKADEKAISAYLGVDISSINSTEASILLGAQIGTDLVPVFGSVLGAIAGWLASVAPWGSLWPDCDGPVASGVHLFTGWGLRLSTAPPNVIHQQTDDNPGVNSQGGCGSNSHYTVTWAVLLDGLPT